VFRAATARCDAQRDDYMIKRESNMRIWTNLALTLLVALPAHAQSPGVEPEAARILKRMTAYMVSLKQFGLDTASTVEVVLTSGQKIQFTSAARTTVQRPDKLRADRVGDIVSQSFYYDGRTLTLFNPDDHYYATVPAPGTLDAMIDFARDSLDVVAPAGDLITEDAYERLMAAATSGLVVGKSAIDGVRCDHLAFRGQGVDWQIWIEEGDRPLPRKYVITSVDVPGSPQFEVIMSHWTTNPDVSARQFEFVPPPGARKIDFLPLGNAGVQP
jgi:hypothetical protein